MFLARVIIYAKDFFFIAATDFLFHGLVYTVTIRIWDAWCLLRRIRVEIEGDLGV
jgi:hypothetical protein